VKAVDSFFPIYIAQRYISQCIRNHKRHVCPRTCNINNLP